MQKYIATLPTAHEASVTLALGLSPDTAVHTPSPPPPAPPHALLPRRSQLLLIPTRLMGRSILGPSPRDEVPPPRTVISKNKSAVKKKLLKLAFTCVCLK